MGARRTGEPVVRAGVPRTTERKDRGLTVRWQRDQVSDRPEWQRPAPALAAVIAHSGPGVHDNREVRVGILWWLVPGRSTVVPVDPLGMDLHDPDKRARRHATRDVPSRLDRFARRVSREDEMDPFDSLEKGARMPSDDQTARADCRHHPARQRCRWLRDGGGRDGTVSR